MAPVAQTQTVNRGKIMDTRTIIIAFLAASSIALGTASAVAGNHRQDHRGHYGHGDGGHFGVVGHGKAFSQERLQERIQAYQERLHKALKLTAEQEPAWTAFVQKVTPKAGELKRPDPEAAKKLTSPERLEKLLERSKQRQAFLAERLEALKTFYAVLTAEQKQAFDAFHSGPHGKKGQPGERREKPENKKG
jgi:Spy/CpxP family protein refolding chaperone